jgi:hypothetical protein
MIALARVLTLVVLVVVLVVALGASAAHAQSTPEVRAEAAARFNRALRLADQGDHAGALAEFKRAHELLPNRLVLTNIGLIYAALGRPVEATDTLDQALAAREGTLPPDLLARARRVRKEQAERIGFLDVTCNVPASIDVGGVDVGRTPLGPVRVASGTVRVGAAAPGRLPARREVTVAGGATVAVAFTLLPAESALAHLELRTGLPGADVLVDGAPAGRTPLPAALALAPGEHVVEVRRPGYLTAIAKIPLPEGARGELTLEPELDPTAAPLHGQLAVTASEPDVELVVDGRPRGPLARTPALALPAGPHQVRVERPGFLPFVRTVETSAGGSTPVFALLVPTAETRLAYTTQARSTRRWAIAALAGGTALLVGGGAMALWAQLSLPDARDRVRAEEKAQSFFGGSGLCDPATGPPEPLRPMCEARLRDLRAEVTRRTTGRALGLAGVGMGLGGLAVGLYLAVHGEDPGRYDQVTTSGGLRLAPALLAHGQPGVVLHNDF